MVTDRIMPGWWIKRYQELGLLPITRWEAMLEFSNNRRGVQVPPMPPRRRVSTEEFEAALANQPGET